MSGAARLNAGQVLIDMSGRLDGKPAEQAKSDELLVAGMKLLAECITKNRGSGAAKNARGIWKRNKTRYDSVVKGTAGASANNVAPKPGR